MFSTEVKMRALFFDEKELETILGALEGDFRRTSESERLDFLGKLINSIKEV